MDYIGLFKAGKILWKTLGESKDIIFITKKMARPAGEFIAGTMVGVIIKDIMNEIGRRYNG